MPWFKFGNTDAKPEKSKQVEDIERRLSQAREPEHVGYYQQLLGKKVGEEYYKKSREELERLEGDNLVIFIDGKKSYVKLTPELRDMLDKYNLTSYYIKVVKGELSKETFEQMVKQKWAEEQRSKGLIVIKLQDNKTGKWYDVAMTAEDATDLKEWRQAQADAQGIIDRADKGASADVISEYVYTLVSPNWGFVNAIMDTVNSKNTKQSRIDRIADTLFQARTNKRKEGLIGVFKTIQGWPVTQVAEAYLASVGLGAGVGALEAVAPVYGTAISTSVGTAVGTYTAVKTGEEIHKMYEEGAGPEQYVPYFTQLASTGIAGYKGYKAGYKKGSIYGYRKRTLANAETEFERARLQTLYDAIDESTKIPTGTKKVVALENIENLTPDDQAKLLNFLNSPDAKKFKIVQGGSSSQETYLINEREPHDIDFLIKLRKTSKLYAKLKGTYTTDEQMFADALTKYGLDPGLFDIHKLQPPGTPFTQVGTGYTQKPVKTAKGSPFKYQMSIQEQLGRKWASAFAPVHKGRGKDWLDALRISAEKWRSGTKSFTPKQYAKYVKRRGYATFEYTPNIIDEGIVGRINIHPEMFRVSRITYTPIKIYKAGKLKTFLKSSTTRGRIVKHELAHKYYSQFTEPQILSIERKPFFKFKVPQKKELISTLEAYKPVIREGRFVGPSFYETYKTIAPRSKFTWFEKVIRKRGTPIKTYVRSPETPIKPEAVRLGPQTIGVEARPTPRASFVFPSYNPLALSTASPILGPATGIAVGAVKYSQERVPKPKYPVVPEYPEKYVPLPEVRQPGYKPPYPSYRTPPTTFYTSSTPPPKTPETEKIKKKQTSYHVYTGSKRITREPLKKSDALSVGGYHTDTTVDTRFRLKEVNVPPREKVGYSKPWSEISYKFKQTGKNKYYEKKKYQKDYDIERGEYVAKKQQKQGSGTKTPFFNIVSGGKMK